MACVEIWNVERWEGQECGVVVGKVQSYSKDSMNMAVRSVPMMMWHEMCGWAEKKGEWMVEWRSGWGNGWKKRDWGMVAEKRYGYLWQILLILQVHCWRVDGWVYGRLSTMWAGWFPMGSGFLLLCFLVLLCLNKRWTLLRRYS